MGMRFSVEDMLGMDVPCESTPDDLTYGYVLDFGYEVVRACERDGVTQKELAERCGMSQPSLSKILSGFANPTVRSLERIAVALGLRLGKPVLATEPTMVSRVDAAIDVPTGKRATITSASGSFGAEQSASAQSWDHDRSDRMGMAA